MLTVEYNITIIVTSSQQFTSADSRGQLLLLPYQQRVAASPLPAEGSSSSPTSRGLATSTNTPTHSCAEVSL